MARPRQTKAKPVAQNGTVASNQASDVQIAADLYANAEAMMTQSLIRSLFEYGRYGLQFGGRRDLIRTLGYLEQPQFNDFWEYSLRGLGARIVEVFPKDTWAIPPTIQENDEPGAVTAFEQDWEHLVEDFDIWGHFYDLDLMAQIGEYGVLLFGLEGVEDYAVPVTNQTRGNGPESLRYLRVYRQNRADIMEWNQDEYTREYGTPAMYRMRTVQTAPQGTTIDHQFFVHPSHTIHFADNTREGRILGAPILLRVIDELFNLMKQGGGLSEMIWRDGKRRIVAALRDGIQSSDVPEEQRRKIEAFAHDMTDFLRVGGMDINTIGGQVPNNEGNMLRLMQVIAGILDYPMRRLFGSEQGQLATEQDNRMANARILARYNRICVPRIIRPFIERMIDLGVLRPPQQPYQILLPDLLALSPGEQADVDRRYVQNIRDYVGAMGEPEMVVTREEFRTLGLSQWQLSPEPEGGFPEEPEDDDTALDALNIPSAEGGDDE